MLSINDRLLNASLVNPDITKTVEFDELRKKYGISSAQLYHALKESQRLSETEITANLNGDHEVHASVCEDRKTLMKILGR